MVSTICKCGHISKANGNPKCEIERTPAWTTEPIVIAPYDPEWPRRAKIPILEIESLLDVRLLAIEHIGSTAVPQLAAKPIIDLNGMLHSFAVIDAAIPILTKSGLNWHYVPTDIDQPPWQRFLVKVVDGRRSCHLHLLPRKSDHWDEHLIFRDSLRKEPALREAYATLKKRLATELHSDREGYTNAKALFVRASIGID